MKPNKVLITGANSGIGKETALRMAEMGYHVIMVCRDQKRGQQALEEVKAKSCSPTVELMLCDLGSLESIKSFHREFTQKHESLNILINNAGIAIPERRETVDGLEMHLGINYIGCYALTSLLLPQLRHGAPSRIINVTSMAYRSGKLDFEDLNLTKKYTALNAYAQSKLAVVLFTRTLSEILKSENITVNCLHPGLSGTQMGVDRDTGKGKGLANLVKLFFQSPEQGAKTSLFLATSESVAQVTGQYFVKCQARALHPSALQEGLADTLLQTSIALTGIQPI